MLSPKTLKAIATSGMLLLLTACAGPTPHPHFKVGKPYTVKGKTYYPSETYNLVEEGEASWYGPGFHGKLTSNGEIFNKRDLTAAHRTVQLPSLARVTNLENGRSVIVRVNDRGPFAKDRIIDVSKSAAEALGFRNKGMAHVRFEVMGAESIALREAAKAGIATTGAEFTMNETGQLPPKLAQFLPYQPDNTPPMAVASQDMPQSATAASQMAPVMDEPATLSSGSFIYVETESYVSMDAARSMAAELSNYAPTSISMVENGNTARYLVRLGPFNSMDNAATIKDTLSRAGVAAQTVTAAN